jgi:hypothetical protein
MALQHLRDIPDLMYSMDVLIISPSKFEGLPIINFHIKTPTPTHATMISPETIPPPFEVLSF